MLKTITFKSIFHLEPFSLHHALCTLVIAALSLGLLHFFTLQPSWLLLSSLLISQAGLNAELTWQAPRQTFFYPCCGLLSASTVLVVSLCAFHFIFTASLLFVLSLGAGYFGWRNRQHYFAAFIIILLALVAAFTPCNLNHALERFYLILLGSLLVFFVRLLYFLYQRSHAFIYAKTIFFQKLKNLYQLIFYTSRPRRPLFGELEESHFQIAWSDCLTALRSLKAKASRAYGHSLDRIWDLTLSLGSLRYRLTDFTVLTMSQDEMQALLKALNAILEDPSAAAFEALQNAIQGFEELYQSMLQTVAKEPLVLLLFIQDLYALKEEFERMALLQHRRGED